MNRGDAAAALKLTPGRARSCCGRDDRAAARPSPRRPTRPTSARSSWRSRARRTGRWSPPTSRARGAGGRGATWTRAAGPGAADVPRACGGWARATSSCRSWPRSPSARHASGPLGRAADQVAERRLDRRPKGLRASSSRGGRRRDGPCSGSALNVSTRAFPDELAETATSLALARRRRRRATRCSRRCWLASSGGSPRTPPTSSRHGGSATLSSAPRSHGTEGGVRGAGITDAGALRVETDAGIVELDAGEVHLQR